jgi:hypothetical protein
MSERDTNDEERLPGEGGPSSPWPPGAGLWLALTAGVSAGIILVSLFPFTFGSGAGSLLGTGPVRLGGVAVQVALFTQLGVVEAELARRVMAGLGIGGWGAAMVGIDAGILALICETLQHWVVSRHSSLIDVLAAVFAGVLGYMLSTLWRGHPE